jgi:uncharacterized protein (TIGR00269 family)
MIKKEDRVGVAVSGGKDSSSLAHILRKLFPKLNMTIIHIDLGIHRYSPHCREKVEALSNLLNGELILYDLEKEMGFAIRDFKSTIYGKKMCSACGAVKRYLLNKIAHDEGLDKIATGHNLDDTVETLLNHYLEGNVQAMIRLKPVLPKTHPKLIAKVKPLFRLTDMEMLFYAEYSELPTRTVECPFSRASRTLRRKEVLSLVTKRIPNFKHLFLQSHYERILPSLEKTEQMATKLYDCSTCGMPTSLPRGDCHFCKLVRQVKAR